MTKPRPQLVTMTPEKAVTLLLANTKNRPLRNGFVAYLAEEIVLGRWRVTGDAITVDTDGALQNGQHRLNAIIKAKRPVPVLFCTGMDPEAFAVQDRGVLRSLADVTGIPRKLVADLSYVHRLFNPFTATPRVSAAALGDILAWWGPANEALARGGGDVARRNNAAIRVACGLRWITSSEQADRDYILDQFSAFLAADGKRMSKAVTTLFTRLAPKTATRNEDRNWMLRQTWVAFDVTRQDIRPMVRNEAAHMANIRAWLRMCPNALLRGPAWDGHPFYFEDAPEEEDTSHETAAEQDGDRDHV